MIQPIPLYRIRVIDLDKLNAAPLRKREQAARLLNRYLEAKWAREAEEHRQAEAEFDARMQAIYGDDD